MTALRGSLARWIAGGCLLFSILNFIPAAYAGDRPLWEVGAGMAGLRVPDYRGSDQNRGYLLPIPYFIYRGDVIQVDRDKVKGLLFSTDQVELVLSVNGTVPVRSGDNTARQGMPNLDPTLELGPELDVRLARLPESLELTAKLPLRTVIASNFHTIHNAGALLQPQLNLDVQGPGDWRLGFVVAALFADRRNHQYVYGVAPEFATPNRPAYMAPGGYSGAQFIAAASKRYDRMWMGAFLKYDNLNAVAFGSSPLLKTHHNLSGGFAIAWVFAKSKERVEAVQ